VHVTTEQQVVHGGQVCEQFNILERSRYSHPRGLMGMLADEFMPIKTIRPKGDRYRDAVEGSLPAVGTDDGEDLAFPPP
jgi:hypothetical protein